MVPFHSVALFLDSSDPRQVSELFRWGALSGVTTNPLIIAREAGDIDLRERIMAVLEVSTGDVSVELTTESESEMLAEALRYAEWDPARICVKVPMSETGMAVHHALIKRSIKTNVTCMMSVNQAYIAALAGATYVSLFYGRIRDLGYDARAVVEQTRAVLDREGLASKIIVGSIRQMNDVNEAVAAGGHIVTVTPPVLRAMVHHPRTVETIAEFNTAWQNRSKK